MNVLDLANPEFIGMQSSNDFWYDGETNVCLTDVVAHKSDYDHTHEGYATTEALNSLATTVSGKASASHTHSNYVNTTTFNAYINEIIALGNAKADANHTHSEYAPTSHSHSNYATSSHTHTSVTTSANGLMIASDKTKLDGMVLATVAEVETYLGI